MYCRVDLCTSYGFNWALVNMIMNLHIPRMVGILLTHGVTITFFRRALIHTVSCWISIYYHFDTALHFQKIVIQGHLLSCFILVLLFEGNQICNINALKCFFLIDSDSSDHNNGEWATCRKIPMGSDLVIRKIMSQFFSSQIFVELRIQSVWHLQVWKWYPVNWRSIGIRLGLLGE
jgi:hypothetical protein